MIDITELILTFRENVRHLWNTTGRNLIVSDYRFGEIEWRLFKNTVLTEASITDDELSVYYKSIKVEPTFEWSNSRFLYAFEKDRVCNWKEIDLSQENELDLRFISFHDFNPQGFKDYRYVRARVIGAKNCTVIIGSDLLIEACCCKYFSI
jgi:hypothetical protein